MKLETKMVKAEELIRYIAHAPIVGNVLLLIFVLLSLIGKVEINIKW